MERRMDPKNPQPFEPPAITDEDDLVEGTLQSPTGAE
jgi:hypothetical protein